MYFNRSLDNHSGLEEIDFTPLLPDTFEFEIIKSGPVYSISSPSRLHSLFLFRNKLEVLKVDFCGQSFYKCNSEVSFF